MLSGAVTLSNARALLEQGRGLVGAGVRAIDLREVTELDSSLLAVLLAWQRDAREANVELSVEHLPEGLETIARLYGVEAFIAGGVPRH